MFRDWTNCPIHLLIGDKRTRPSEAVKDVKVGALFGTVLKQKKSATNKALTLRCFSATICFVPINLLFWTSCSILTLYNGT